MRRQPTSHVNSMQHGKNVRIAYFQDLGHSQQQRIRIVCLNTVLAGQVKRRSAELRQVCLINKIGCKVDSTPDRI